MSEQEKLLAGFEVAPKMGCKSDDGRRFPLHDRQVAKEAPAPVPSRVVYCLPAVSAAASNELFSEGRPLPEIVEEVAWLAQLLMQAALEAEVIELPGRSRYQRAAAGEDARIGSRNG